MKSLTILIPIMNSLRWTMPMLGCLKYMTSDSVEYLIMDNGSTEPVEDRLRHYIKPKRLNFIRYETNQGLINNLQEAYKICESDLLMFLHTDCYIFEKNWDQRIRRYFEEIPKLGMAGFFGAQGCMPNGGRLQDVERPGQMSGLSNMLEADIHGIKLRTPWRSCAIFDSFSMIMSMEMLRMGNGIDMRYKFHHLFDRDISLESLKRGYKNIVVDIPCHHIGGVTHETEQYQSWLLTQIGSKFEDGKLHNDNAEKFIKKWESVLPIYIEDNFSFRTGRVPIPDPVLEYKGDKIVGAEL